jgi:hypothetical protein
VESKRFFFEKKNQKTFFNLGQQRFSTPSSPESIGRFTPSSLTLRSLHPVMAAQAAIHDFSQVVLKKNSLFFLAAMPTVQ